MPWSLDPKLLQMHRDGCRLFALQFPLGGQSGQSLTHLRSIAQLRSGPFPARLLGWRQLAQIEHVPLNDSAIRAAPVLNQTPIRIGFSVFAPFMASQEDCHEEGFYHLRQPAEEPRSALQAILGFCLLLSLRNPKIFARIFLKIGSGCESQAKTTPFLCDLSG